MTFRFSLVLAVLLLVPIGSVAGWAQETAPERSAPERPALSVYDAVVVATYPHDPGAFTQGLMWHEGWLYESTGRVGSSTIRKVDLETGEPAITRAIPFPEFGEGLALWEDELVSLTWRDGVVHRWRLDDLSSVSSFSEYPYQGWGFARFGDHLVASDGTDTLRFLDPDDYSAQRSITVTINGQPLPQLNELEVVGDEIFANVWKTAFIVGIDPETGVVRTVIDCRSLRGNEGDDPEGVLNGIAWDEKGKRLFVTGKLWSKLFQIELKPRRAPPPAQP